MKHFFTISTIAVASMLQAQSPDAMSYQAVLRNSTNELITNTTVGMRLTIIKGGINGTAVYSETQRPLTNQNGLVNIQIGNGNIVQGSLSTIDWGSDTYFIHTETDLKGGSNYTISGTSQMLSVPYALYAKTSGSSLPGPQGEKGAIGPQGVQGIPGEKGETGSQGIQGTKGAQGEKGAIGPQGIQGIPGEKGETGPQGIQGTKGAIGEKGAIGPQGIQGIPGEKGETGPQGIQGTKGAQGEKGAIGPQGIQGIPGEKGETGPQGIQGTKGAQGENGAIGPQGVQGLPGEKGETGPQGIQGVTGNNTLAYAYAENPLFNGNITSAGVNLLWINIGGVTGFYSSSSDGIIILKGGTYWVTYTVNLMEEKTIGTRLLIDGSPLLKSAVISNSPRANYAANVLVNIPPGSKISLQLFGDPQNVNLIQLNQGQGASMTILKIH